MPQAAKEEITLSRIFDVPPELVYRAFVDPDQLCLWFGPAGYSVPCESVQIDARPGGFQRFVMVSDEDPALRSTVDMSFSDVVENELLDGHQEVEGTPGTRVRLRLEFRAEGHGKTRLDLRQGPYTEELGLATKTGWESSFTRLDSLLRRSL
ncbi:MAG: SRPBCC family protein [Streptosporangiaceae bacterium]